MPIYWFGLIAYAISIFAVNGNFGADLINVVSHFLFLNGLTPSWWSGFMGGTGYFGILALMWIVFPIYLKRLELGKDAFVYGIIFIATVFIATQFLKGLNGILGFSPTEKFGDWIWYINRGLYCYALGSMLYCFVRDVKLNKVNTLTKKVAVYLLVLMILLKMAGEGGKFDGLLFTVLWCAVIVLSVDEKIWLIDNPLWAFLGKNITELFVAHIVLYYVLVQNQQMISAGPKAFVLIFILSIFLAPILKVLISKPGYKLMDKIYGKIMHRCKAGDVNDKA